MAFLLMRLAAKNILLSKYSLKRPDAYEAGMVFNCLYFPRTIHQWPVHRHRLQRWPVHHNGY